MKSVRHLGAQQASKTVAITNNTNFERQGITVYNSNAIMIAKLLQEMPTVLKTCNANSSQTFRNNADVVKIRISGSH